jgi:ABC-2 type transport system permease protein
MIRRLWALFRKEQRTLFTSPIAYIVLTAYVMLSGVYFFQHLLTYNRLLFAFQAGAIGGGGFDAGTVPIQINSLNEVFIPAASDFSFLLLAVLPLVTMRVFAEERAHGTDELLLTTPLRPWEIGLAKHLTTYCFVLLILAVSAVYPAVVVSKSKLGMEHLFALYVGQLGYGVAVAAIGLACSSLTASQIVAAVLAYTIPFILIDFTWLRPVVSEGVAAFLDEVALQGHFESFARGVIEPRRGLYFGGIVALGFTVSVGSMALGRAR